MENEVWSKETEAGATERLKGLIAEFGRTEVERAWADIGADPKADGRGNEGSDLPAAEGSPDPAGDHAGDPLRAVDEALYIQMSLAARRND